MFRDYLRVLGATFGGPPKKLGANFPLGSHISLTIKLRGVDATTFSKFAKFSLIPLISMFRDYLRVLGAKVGGPPKKLAADFPLGSPRDLRRRV
jgi:hypothetical protein